MIMIIVSRSFLKTTEMLHHNQQKRKRCYIGKKCFWQTWNKKKLKNDRDRGKRDETEL